MPTARELLEQADALMRRNRRSDGGESQPRLTTQGPEFRIGSARGPGGSPRTIQREPIAPSVARTSLPVDPTESPAIAGAAADGRDAAAGGKPAAPPARIQPPVELDVPLLTDAIDDLRAANTPLDGLADDVPVLTDAVEEIDVGLVDEAARGEPSYWELTMRGETSVLGRAPDSIVAVPPLESASPAVPQVPPAGRDPLGLDQPPDGEAAPDAVDGAHVDHAFDADAGKAAPAHAEPLALPTPALEEAPLERAPARLPPASEEDQQRIREIAEEIGMQVLQRIDIFTDTTLRGQLGERLRPVVERAAADLVAAINEHVGELLRAQIAEAIENEIESWKNR